MERRQRAADGWNVADCSGLDAKNQNHSEYRNNRGQRSRKLFGDSGKEESDGHRQRHQAGHGDHGAALQKHLLTRGWVGGKELLQLGAEDDDSQTVDKAEHDAFRHQTDVLGPFEDANNDGYVAFKIKTKPTLAVGDTFSNNANIYFDYNFPIVTNTYTTTITALSSQDFDFNNVFTLSPVPSKEILTITTKQDVIMSSASIYNTLGQLVQVITDPTETINVSELNAGNYFIRIFTDKGSATGKFIKE